MAEKPSIRSLAKRDFSSEEFNTALKANLDKKKQKDDEWEDITPDDEWEDVTPSEPTSIATKSESDIDSYKPEGSEEKGLIRRGIEFMTEPLTDAPSRFAREISQDWDLPTKEGKVHPLAAFGRGAMEGLGDVVSGLTSPSSIIATLAGGGAIASGRAGFASTANTLRNLTRAASIPNIIHGGETVLDPEKSFGERAMGATELAGGAAGLHFPKSSIAPAPKKSVGIGESVTVGGKKYTITGVDERGKPKVKLITEEPQSDVPLIPTEKSTEADSVRIDELSAKVQSNTATPEEISELAEHFDNMFGVTPRSKPSSAEAQAAALPAEEITPIKEPDIVDKLFPEMTNRQSKRSLDLGIQETPLIDELNKPEPRQKGRPPITMKDIDSFLRDEDGSAYNPFMGEEELGYSARTNDPDAIDLGELAGREIDLEQAALEAGSETARPVNPLLRFLKDESGELNLDQFLPDTRIEKEAQPQFGEDAYAPKVVRPSAGVEYAFDWPDFHPDGSPEPMYHVTDGPDAGSTLSASTLRERGIELPEPPAAPGFFSRLGTTLADETGSVPRKPKGGNVWANLDDRVKTIFSDNGIGPADIEGMSLKDVNDTYNAVVAQMEGADILPSAPKLVKPSGERVAPAPQMDANAAFAPDGDLSPIIEAKRQLDMNRAADFKYKALLPETMQHPLRQGESFQGRLNDLLEATQPFTPEMDAELAAFRESFDASQQAPVDTRADVPLLRRKNLPEAFKKFLGDESGEIRFDIPPSKPKAGAPRIKMMGFEDLDPELPIAGREAPEFPEPGMFRKAMDTPIGMMSVDLPFMTSAAFRQASPLAWTKNWFDAWGKAARAYGSEAVANQIETEIRNSEFFKARYKPIYDKDGNVKSYKELPSVAESLGVRMTDFKHITSREELTRSQWAEKFPWVKPSNRAYAAFLNSLRKSQFEQLMNQANWAGEGAKDFVTAKRIAEFINDATGRSTIKTDLPGGGKLDFERNADDLAKILWSPRLLASRVKFLNPMTYINTEPQIRQQYINGLLRSVGTWWAFAGMASLLGDQLGKNVSISTDVSNADFGKIRIGDTRIDPGAGFQQLLVYGARMAPQIEGMDTGKFTSSTTGKITNYGEGYKPRTRWDTTLDFASSKLHPMAKLAFDLLRATKDRPVHLGDRAVEMMLPMMTQDIMATLESDPDLALAIAPLSSIGMGATTYDKNSFNEPSFTDNIEEYLGMRPRSLAGTVGR